MDVKDAVCVITGGAGGIGSAFARRFTAAGAAAVVVVDRDPDRVGEIADPIGAVAETVDVTDAAAVDDLVQRTLAREGRIDLFCSNAGILTGVGLEDPDGIWQQAFDVNVMAQVHAARAVLPSMLERGRGYLLNTASAAGLLITPGDAPYTVTKHGAVGLAEWLAVTYGSRGIGVSVLCPLGVATPMLMDPLQAGDSAAKAVAASGRIISPDDVTDVVIDALAEERFLILPHAEVGRYWAQKASDPERWLTGMRRLVSKTE
jgi:NAD(P)-dependent dehydrogenase (short-subunit alcohol dehydrogenase family)